MHIYIPLWLWLIGVIAVVLVIGIAIGLTVMMGLSDTRRVLEMTLWKPYPIPRDARNPHPRQNQPWSLGPELPSRATLQNCE